MMEKMTFEQYKNLIIETAPTEDCPVQKTMEVFAGKWSTRVLFELTKVDSIRFGELSKRIKGITNTMLSATLKELEENGLLTRTQFNEIPPHVEYELSEKGKMMYPIFVEMLNWAKVYM